MKTLLVFILLVAALSSAEAVPLSIVNVSFPAVNCIFDPTCRIFVGDTSDDIVLNGTVAVGIEHFLQSRTFTGSPGTPAAGLFGYMYRIDLIDLMSTANVACVTSFRIPFAPLVRTLNYDNLGGADDVFVGTGGGLGTVAPTSAEQIGDTITFTFQPPVCAGASSGEGQTTFFFGLVSTEPPGFVVSQVVDANAMAYELDARAPAASTATATPTSSGTPTLTETPTSSTIPSPTSTRTSSATPTDTTTPTPSETPTSTSTPTETATATSTATPFPPCGGDCGDDGAVTVDELLIMVNIALGSAPAVDCTAGDGDGDGHITIDDIVNAVANSLTRCPPTPTATATLPPTDTPTVTVTPTPTTNHAPIVPSLGIYRTYPGYSIQLPIGVTDPDGSVIQCTAENVPDGALLDEPSGLFRWTPRDDQLGPFSVPFTCTDDGLPPLSASGRLTLKVSPLDGCSVPACDQAAGCQTTLVDVTQNCCFEAPSVRVAEPVADCPQGRVLFLGGNTGEGFGRLQNCDRLQVRTFPNAAVLRFHLEARCLNVNAPVIVHARMETADRLLFDRQSLVVLIPSQDGYERRMNVVFPVNGPAPFFDLEEAEANLTVTVTDFDGVMVEEHLRLVLTFRPLPDLPDVDPIVPPAP